MRHWTKCVLTGVLFCDKLTRSAFQPKQVLQATNDNTTHIQYPLKPTEFNSRTSLSISEKQQQWRQPLSKLEINNAQHKSCPMLRENMFKNIWLSNRQNFQNKGSSQRTLNTGLIQTELCPTGWLVYHLCFVSNSIADTLPHALSKHYTR